MTTQDNYNLDYEKLLLNNIRKLPCVLISIIKDYIPSTTSVFLNKTLYLNNHFLIKELVPKYNIEKYIRYILELDYSFVFEQVLKENYKRWNNIKSYIYKNVIYKNYLAFIVDFCIENESWKCRSLINCFLIEHGLGQKEYKNNFNKNKRWKI
jgi:hypothetical protein